MQIQVDKSCIVWRMGVLRVERGQRVHVRMLLGFVERKAPAGHVAQDGLELGMKVSGGQTVQLVGRLEERVLGGHCLHVV